MKTIKHIFLIFIVGLGQLAMGQTTTVTISTGLTGPMPCF